MARIQIRTVIDITNTGVKRLDIGSEKPLNQYRNFTTFMQVFGIRSIFSIVQSPVQKDGEWTMIIDTDRDDVYHDGTDPVGLLKNDLDTVPIITGLDEIKAIKQPVIKTMGKQPNTFVSLLQ